MLVFTHIPRTGGTSLRTFISKRVEKTLYVDSLSEFAFLPDNKLNGFDFIATHCGYEFFKRISVPHKKIIVIRDPIERILSHYNYLRNLEKNVSYASHYAKKLSLIDFLQTENSSVNIGIKNAQFWHIISDKNQSFRNKMKDISKERLVSIALKNLREYDYVGVTPDLEKLIVKINLAGDVKSLPRCAESNASAKDLLISPKALGLMESISELDMIIYNEANKLSNF